MHVLALSFADLTRPRRLNALEAAEGSPTCPLRSIRGVTHLLITAEVPINITCFYSFSDESEGHILVINSNNHSFLCLFVV